VEKLKRRKEKEYLDNLKAQAAKYKPKNKFQATSTVSRGQSTFKPVVFTSKKDVEKDFIEFVGFRGYHDKKGFPIIDATHTITIKEIRDPESNELLEIENIYNFKYPYHPGQAHPEPIDEKNIAWGILPHEVEGFHAIRKYLKTGIMFKWPRGFGKTFLACWFIEWSMEKLGYPWLYMSETAIMNDVAFWVWQWAQKTKSSKGGFRKEISRILILSLSFRMELFLGFTPTWKRSL